MGTYAININKEGDSCLNCKLLDNIQTTFGLIFNANTPYCIAKNEVISKNIVCPLIELKPKQLEWTYHEDATYTATPHKNLTFMFKQYYNEECYAFLNKVEIGKYNDLRASELKKICQDYYDDMFYEMIGVK